MVEDLEFSLCGDEVYFSIGISVILGGNVDEACFAVGYVLNEGLQG